MITPLNNPEINAVSGALHPKTEETIRAYLRVVLIGCGVIIAIDLLQLYIRGAYSCYQKSDCQLFYEVNGWIIGGLAAALADNLGNRNQREAQAPHED